MDQQKRESLERLYRELSDEALIDMLRAGAGEYQEGVFELLLTEARVRGIEEKAFEKAPVEDPAPQQQQASRPEFVEVMEFRDPWEQSLVESLMQQTDIPYYVGDERVSRLGDRLGPRFLMVDKQRLEEVRELLKGFEGDPPFDEGQEEQTP